MSRGLFIVLEGIDSCGKSTQIQLLKKKLSSLNYPVFATREPSNGPIGRLIRREYLSGKRKDTGGIINKLCEIDRIDHLINEQDGISKNLKQGKHVICDRYILSTIAYSLYNNKNILSDEKKFNDSVMNIVNRFIDNQGIKPDVIFRLKITPEEAINRINSRGKNISIYEDNIAKSRKIDKCYDRAIDVLLKNKLFSIVTINGEDKKDIVLDDIWQHISSLLISK